MFRARCSHPDCTREFADEVFDNVADALQDHHFAHHGVLMGEDGRTEAALAAEWDHREPEKKKQATK